jgi:tetratricopeptide (TPR) repeat protein
MPLRRAAACLLIATTWLGAPPVQAADEWYVYYQRAVDERTRGLRGGKCTDAVLADLNKAAELRPRSELNARTYGVDFVDYTPYYHLGLCYLDRRDNARALGMFNSEEAQGTIKRRNELWAGLQARRAEAQATDEQNSIREAREEAQKFLREGDEKARQKKYDEALAAWTKAESIFKNLDPALAAAVEKRKADLAAERREITERQTRAERIESLLAEGDRLSRAGNETDAILRFEEVLSLDRGNSRAQEGRAVARERLRQTSTKAALAARFDEGQRLFAAGQFADSLRPLADAAADPTNVAARTLLVQAQDRVRKLRVETERQMEIARLEAEAEALFSAGRHAEAELKYEDMLRLDPQNVKAIQRRERSLELTARTLLARLFPNLTPLIVMMSPTVAAPQVDEPTVKVEGVISDDRALEKVEVYLNGTMVAQMRPTAVEAGEAARTQAVNSRFSLAPGMNELRILATDAQGLTASESFSITRRLRFYETRAFLPAATGTALGLVGLAFAAQRWRRRRAVTRRFNPYIAGAPVLADDMFFGRQKLLTRILNVLHHNSLMITGERRIGKTSLLHHLKKALERDDREDYRFYPVPSDLQGVPESGFFHSVMADVVETTKPPAAVLETLKFGPDDDSYDGRDFSHDLQRVIEDLKGRTPKKVKLALLIDEVDVLNEYSDRVNQRLRSIFMKTFSENLVAVMSGVGIRRNWKSEGSPWYNFFDEIELTAFTREEAEELIRSPVQGVFRYTSDAVESIIDISRMKPYAIQRLCIHAVNRMLEDGRSTITVADVAAAGHAFITEERREERSAASAVS